MDRILSIGKPALDLEKLRNQIASDSASPGGEPVSGEGKIKNGN